MLILRSRILSQLVLSLALLTLAGCKPSQQVATNSTTASAPTARQTIVFITDFGTANDAVAICHAVMYGIAPDARIMDITHQVTPFSIEEGARILEGVTPYYPAGTVFVGVIDPGVGTSRKAVVVKTKKGQFFVVPDNGLITPIIERDGLDSAREITNTNWMIGQAISSTFHGRDIFSPVGAHLAAGWDYTMVGPVVDQLVRLTPKVSTVTDKGVDGDIIALDDPFGSLITDISKDQFEKLGYVFRRSGHRSAQQEAIHSALSENLHDCSGRRTTSFHRLARSRQPRRQSGQFLQRLQNYSPGHHLHLQKGRPHQGQVVNLLFSFMSWGHNDLCPHCRTQQIISNASLHLNCLALKRHFLPVTATFPSTSLRAIWVNTLNCFDSQLDQRHSASLSLQTSAALDPRREFTP